jgi:hypothetical protein
MLLTGKTQIYFPAQARQTFSVFLKWIPIGNDIYSQDPATLNENEVLEQGLFPQPSLQDSAQGGAKSNKCPAHIMQNFSKL